MLTFRNILYKLEQQRISYHITMLILELHVAYIMGLPAYKNHSYEIEWKVSSLEYICLL